MFAKAGIGSTQGYFNHMGSFFPSQFGSGSPSGALQNCRGNASVLTHGTLNLDRDLFRPKICLSETPQYMMFLT